MRISFLQTISLFCLFTPTLTFSQLNMTLQDSVTYLNGVNDVCGWTAPDGSEYAVIGLHGGVAIVDIDVTPLQEVAFVPTEYNLWKDINTYGHYAYVSSEAQVGLLIIDLQYLPDSVETYIWQDSLPTDNGPRPFKKAHTLWTDENGLLYLMGTNLNGGGVIMCDVANSPTDPIFLGYGPAIYSHDCYTRDSIIYSAEIYAGDLSIYDAHDPQNMVLLGRVKTPQEFTHNSWLSDSGNVMFTTDERSNSYITSYDITDPGNIIELDRYRQASTEGSGNIVHNVYVWKEDWIVAAYYANGTVIVDGSRPDNLVEVGNFDSYLGADGGFPGVWGSFPWMPSGKILSSDRNTGLYVFIPNYVRACFLEGTVVDSITGQPLSDATIRILSDEIVNAESSKINGGFKMGKAVPGSYNVQVTKYGYYPKTITLDFINGEVLTPVIELSPIPTYQVNGKVVYATGENTPFAKVTFFGQDAVYEVTCDENGDFLVPAAYKGGYDLHAGVWGHTYEENIDLDGPRQFTIELVPGYKDNFDIDLGWTITDTVTLGAWKRGIPTQQLLFETYSCSSAGDSPNDLGGFAYATGISTSEDVQDSEVSGGTTWLSSPAMDLSQAIEPRIVFDYWLCEFPPNQYNGVQVWLTNSIDTLLLENLVNDTVNGSWQTKQYDVPLFPEAMDQIRFVISATDTTSGQSDYILKVHLDKFKLNQSGLSAEAPVQTAGGFMIYPNPSSDGTFYLVRTAESELQLAEVRLMDINGQLLEINPVIDADQRIRFKHQLTSGMYFVQWKTTSGIRKTEKILIIQ